MHPRLIINVHITVYTIVGGHQDSHTYNKFILSNKNVNNAIRAHIFETV